MEKTASFIYLIIFRCMPSSNKKTARLKFGVSTAQYLAVPLFFGLVLLAKVCAKQK